MIYAYCRCSTNETKQDVNRQIRDLKKLDNTLQDKNIFTEYASGSKTDRKELTRLLETVKQGDTILATEPSRITRSTKQLIEIIEIAKEKKLILKFGSINLDCSKENIDPMTQCTLQIISVFSELEKNLISERVKSGMDNARAKGKKIGRPTLTKEQLPKEFFILYSDYKNKKINKTEMAKMLHVSRVTLNTWFETYESKSN